MEDSRDVAQFLGRRHDGVLTDLSPFPLVKVVRKTRDQQEFRDENDFHIFLLCFFVQGSFDQRLFGDVDGEVIVIFVVLSQGHLLFSIEESIAIERSFKENSFDDVVRVFAVIGHDLLVDQLLLHEVPLLHLLHALVGHVDFVDHLKDSLISHDFDSRINSQEESSFQQREVAGVALVDNDFG